MKNKDSTEIKASRGESGKVDSARCLHVILLGLGLVGWLTFVLACVGGPSWSPDGSKVLFAWRDYERGRYGVAVYDRSTRATRVLFQHLFTKPDDEGAFNVAPLWQSDGTRAIVAMTTPDDEAHCTLLSIPMRSALPLEAYDLGKKTICTEAGAVPQIGTRLYTGTEDGITWLDLATGNADSKTIDGGVNFVGGHEGQLIYQREVTRPISDPDKQDAREKGFEFGRVQLGDLDLSPGFTLWSNDAAVEDLEDASIGAWEPHGSRILMIAPIKGTDKILILDQAKGIVGTLMPVLGGLKSYRLGTPVWSKDGKTFFAAAITKGQGEGIYDYSLAEIPLTGAAGRLTKLASFHKKSTHSAEEPDAEASEMSGFDSSEDFLSRQIALSPDGTIIAATPANMDQESFDDRDHALFLVDMRQPTRRVTRIPFPKLLNAPVQTSRATK